jgi:hypothetical protein
MALQIVLQRYYATGFAPRSATAATDLDMPQAQSAAGFSTVEQAKEHVNVAASSSNDRPPPTTIETLKANSKFAYAFVVGGCDPDRPKYRGFLYNVLVSAKILRDFGTRGDIVVMIQMAFQSFHDRLPPLEEQMLQDALGVHLIYIPKNPHENFYEIQMEKFRILELVQYQRVLFLDADVMPTNKMDYLFEMSINSTAGSNTPILQENVVLSYKADPSSGGFFLLKPGNGELEQLHKIIELREEKAKDLPPPKFDEVEGWGHEIKPPDKWETGFANKFGTKWTFYGANADQGLLYVPHAIALTLRMMVRFLCFL